MMIMLFLIVFVVSMFTNVPIWAFAVSGILAGLEVLARLLKSRL